MTTITSQDAMRLIAKMRELYGRKFDQQWDGVELDSMASTVAECLSGLSTEELCAGVARMMREPWPPTIPEFRQWCEQGGAWLTADEAWATALAYVADPKAQITVQAKAALTKVRSIIDQEGQKAASRAFKDIYSRRMTEDKAAGVSQSIAPKVLPKPEPMPFTPPTAEEAANQKAMREKYLKNLQAMLGQPS